MRREHTSIREYQSISYIQGTGTQYIDLGPESQSPNGFYSKLTIQYVNSSYTGRVIGSHNLYSPYGRNGLAITSNGVELSYGNVYPNYSTSKTPGMDYVLEVQTYIRNAFVKVNGAQVLTNTNNYGLLSSLNILVLQDQWRIANNYGCLQIIIKHIEFTNNNHQMDLHPYIRVADSKPGLLDLLNNQFYTNSGTGEFLYN